MESEHHLAERIRDLIQAYPSVVEKKMFGGIGWMLQGNMAVCASSTGELLVRVEPDEVDAFVREPGVRTFGREGAKPMSGFVLVEATDLPEAEFAQWVERGANRALSLPPK